MQVAQLNDDPDKEDIWKKLVYEYCPKIISYVADKVRNYEIARDIVWKCVRIVCEQSQDYKSYKDLERYLFIIIRNELYDHLKYEKRIKENLEKYRLPEIPNEHTDSLQETSAIIKAQAKRVREEILKLPEQQQLIIRLKYFENKSYKDIARLLGVADSTVYNQCRIGRMKLKEALGADFFRRPADDDDPE